MDISPVTSHADLTDFCEVLDAALAADFVGLPAAPFDFWLPTVEGTERGDARTMLWVGRADGVPVGMVNVRVPLLDNLTSTNLEVYVHPEHRRRGYGRQLVTRGLEEIAQLGRTRVFCPVASWPDRPLAAATLLEENGFRAVVEDTRRMIDFREHPPQPGGDVPEGYRIEQWVETAPEELVEGLAYLSSRMSTDPPMGDMDYEPEVWDAARYREMEAEAQQRKQRRFATAVVHESGQVAGFTDISVRLSAPETAEQWSTIVDPDHRGHGLGLVLKKWNHALLAERAPEVRYLNTWNASSNSYMIRVNEAVGYRAMETWTEYQLDR